MAVFEENKVLSYPCRRWHHLRCRAKTMTFSNISVITEDIYLNFTQVVFYIKRGTDASKGGNPQNVLAVVMLLF